MNLLSSTVFYTSDRSILCLSFVCCVLCILQRARRAIQHCAPTWRVYKGQAVFNVRSSCQCMTFLRGREAHACFVSVPVPVPVPVPRLLHGKPNCAQYPRVLGIVHQAACCLACEGVCWLTTTPLCVHAQAYGIDGEGRPENGPP